MNGWPIDAHEAERKAIASLAMALRVTVQDATESGALTAGEVESEIRAMLWRFVQKNYPVSAVGTV